MTTRRDRVDQRSTQHRTFGPEDPDGSEQCLGIELIEQVRPHMTGRMELNRPFPRRHDNNSSIIERLRQGVRIPTARRRNSITATSQRVPPVNSRQRGRDSPPLPSPVTTQTPDALEPQPMGTAWARHGQTGKLP